MSSAASEPALIGLDWGTTSFRAYLISAEGTVLDRIAEPQGIMHVEGRDFDGACERLLASWLAVCAVPILASGMITSRNGWVETPYLRTPADAEEQADALVAHTTASGRGVWFVTGLTLDHPNGAPDVMRGEETQIAGAVASGAMDGTFLSPGTHNKWITVRNGRIEDFTTYMTGEVYAALRDHSILGTLIAPGPFAAASFRKGVEAGLANEGGLLHLLFHVRTLPLFGRIPQTDTADRLSGLLIGSELREALAKVPRGEAVTIVGQSDLARRYAAALDIAGYSARVAADDIAALGHFVIAKAAGLLA